MLLSDQDLVKVLKSEDLMIHPWTIQMIQPASVDIELGEVGRSPDEETRGGRKVWVLQPGEFVLACTRQSFKFPNNLAGRVEGKSTWGRRGLLVHAAGFIDPGFAGQLTLEFKVLANEPVRVVERNYICQLAVWKLSAYALYPYGSRGRGHLLHSHYQNQMGITPAWEENPQ